MLPPDELKRRLDAARTLRGLRQTDLAALLEKDGHGKHDLGRLERGTFTLTRALRRSLADHLDVPEAWFTEEDVNKVIGQPERSQLDRMERLLEDSRALLLALADGLKPEQPAEAPRGPSWANMDRLREDLAARDREASPAAPETQTSSTG